MAASEDEEEATLSIPSLALVAILSFFIIRYFVRSRAANGAAASQRAGQRFTSAQVEQLAQMFPQLNQRDIMWDLQRNGGSVPATTERVLAGAGLDRAPPSFQPLLPVSRPPTSSATGASLSASKAAEPDLITRYNLQSRVSTKGKEKEAPSPPTGWAGSKEQRQEMLRRRRDEMILAARRRMQEKELERSSQ